MATLPTDIAALYDGVVMHNRLRPVRHRFTYRVFSLFLDIDRLPELKDSVRWLSVDRWAPLAFYHKDHGARDGSRLRPWVERQLAEQGLQAKPHRIMLLSIPRLFGYAFNPLSIYFCYDERNQLQNLVYEVKNTFGGQHAYALGSDAPTNARTFSQSCEKDFYVSPFIAMQARYHFRLRPPEEQLTLAIRETADEACFFVASHTAKRRSLTNRNLIRCLWVHGLLGLKVMAGIHWEAFRLWLKGAPYFSRDVDPSTG